MYMYVYMAYTYSRVCIYIQGDRRHAPDHRDQLNHSRHRTHAYMHEFMYNYQFGLRTQYRCGDRNHKAQYRNHEAHMLIHTYATYRVTDALHLTIATTSVILVPCLLKLHKM